MIIGPKLPQNTEISSFEIFLTARAQQKDQNNQISRLQTHDKSNSFRIDKKDLTSNQENNKKSEERNSLMSKNVQGEKETFPNETNDSNKMESRLKKQKRPDNLVLESAVTDDNNSNLKKIITFLEKDTVFGDPASPDLSPDSTQHQTHSSPSRNNFLTILNKVKNLAKKIKKDLYYKDAKNMSSHSKQILNDRSHYELNKGKKNVSLI